MKEDELDVTKLTEITSNTLDFIRKRVSSDAEFLAVAIAILRSYELVAMESDPKTYGPIFEKFGMDLLLTAANRMV